MDGIGWVTQWEQWRGVMGRAGSSHARRVERFLETRPKLLYWGDSWFSTPLYLNLARQSLLRIDGAAMLTGQPGATAAELFNDRLIDDRMRRLQRWRFDAICLSAGGNDALSQNLRKVFPSRSGTPADRLSVAEAAVRFLESDLLAGVLQRYRGLCQAVERARSKQRLDTKLIAHSYAAPVRIGVAADLTIGNLGLAALVRRNVGPWLAPVMRPWLEDDAAVGEFGRAMLRDGFHGQVMQPLEEEFGNFFHAANLHRVRTLHQADAWYDEIHPTEAGFAAATAFNNTLRAALPAAKRRAVR